MDCIFCKIINGELPLKKIYEDEHTLAFLDIAGDVDGHTLVIPKKHVTNILDCDRETLARLMDTVKLISNHYAENCGYDGVNLINASGEAAQQSVFHLHIHVVPRKTGDGLNVFPKFAGAKLPLDEMLERLRLKAYNNLD